MAFEGLTQRLAGTFKKLKNRGKLSEADVKEAMREVRLALLEADVNYGVAKKFVADVTQKCIGAGVLESLTPAQQVKDSKRRVDRADGQHPPAHQSFFPHSHRAADVRLAGQR